MNTVLEFLEKFEDKDLEPYELTRSAGIDTSVYDPTRRPEGSVLAEEFEHVGVGRIKLPFRCVGILGHEIATKNRAGRLRHVDPTVCDLEKLLGKDYEDKLLDELLVPHWSGYQVSTSLHVMMKPMAAANRVLDHMERLGADTTPADLQKVVWRYLSEVADLLSGRGGLLRQEVYETRIRHSMRAVCVPDSSLAFDEVGISSIHRNIMEQAEARSKNGVVYCLLDREPNLWEGSVHVMKLKLMDRRSDVIYLSPLSHAPMGADYDGDCVTVVVPPHLPSVMEELKAACGSNIKKYSEWTEEFLLADGEAKVNWKAPRADQTRRKEARFTVTPSELMDPTTGTYFEQCRLTGAKRIPDDLPEYAKGNTLANFKVVAEATSLELSKMKRELGLTGALTDKINQLLYAHKPDLLPIGFRLKERITQLLLDSKSGTDCFDSNQLSMLFNLRGPYTNHTKQMLLKEVKAMGFTPEMLGWTKQIMVVLWKLLPINQAMRQVLPRYQVTRTSDVSSLFEALRRNSNMKCIVDDVMAVLGGSDDTAGTGDTGDSAEDLPSIRIQSEAG